MYMFTRAANDASIIQKLLTDTNKTSNASLLLLTPFASPQITVGNQAPSFAFCYGSFEYRALPQILGTDRP